MEIHFHSFSMDLQMRPAARDADVSFLCSICEVQPKARMHSDRGYTSKDNSTFKIGLKTGVWLCLSRAVAASRLRAEKFLLGFGLERKVADGNRIAGELWKACRWRTTQFKQWPANRRRSNIRHHSFRFGWPHNRIAWTRPFPSDAASR